MEEYEPAKPILPPNITPQPNQNEISETKNYKLYLNNDTFLLVIETSSNGDINFKVKQINIITRYYFSKKYSFEEILKKLYLYKDLYESISKILIFIDNSISHKKMILNEDQNQNILLSLKKSMDFEEVECKIELEKIKIKDEEIIDILIEQINEIKSKDKIENNNQYITSIIKQIKEENEKNKKENEEMKNNINKLIEEKNKEKEEMEKKLNLLIEENKTMKDNLEKFKNFFEEKMKEQQSGNINIFNEINTDNFSQNPNELKFKELLANNHSSAGMLSNFTVFTGLKDNIPYLVYNNNTNFNLEVIRLNDNTIMHSLQKHNNKVTVIKYYRKETNEEYLLSCDLNILTIIWDIQNNYNIKSIIQEEFKKPIWDAHILFNISGKDFIILSSGEKVTPIKLYELKNNNSQFMKNIFGTKDKITNYMIVWIYNNKYYIINFSSDISIYNIFENECYAQLNAEKSRYYCGFLYKKNNLCANDRNNNLLRIWDLVNKNLLREIKYEGELGREIIPWNDIYTIVACNHCFIIVDLEKGEITNKISVEKSCLGGVKKIRSDKIGECLIIADFNNNIEIFNFNI